MKIDSTEDPATRKDQSECPLFTEIPVEIRHMIYRQLLTTLEIIEKAHKHLGSKDTALVDNYQPIPNIDAAVLRTCRLVYSEALPILYGQNTFEFSSANAIRAFQSKSLIGYPLGMPSPFCLPALEHERDQLFFQSTAGCWKRTCRPPFSYADYSKAFNFNLAPMGRLTMVRSIVLCLNAEYRWAHTTLGANGQRGAPNRDHIWRDWSTTLFSESDDLCPWGGRNALGFPALEKLTLDFAEWQLTENEGLLVRVPVLLFQSLLISSTRLDPS